MRWFASIIVCFFLAQANAAIELTEPGIFVTESLLSPSIFWLDDDNLLISGAKKERSGTEPPGARLLHYVVSRQALYDLGALGGGLCVSNGQIRFWRPTPATQGKPLSQQQSQWVAGGISVLAVTGPPPPSPPTAFPPLMNPLRGCKFPNEETNSPWLEAAKKSGRQFLALKPEHGWLEMAIHPRYGIRANPTFPITIHPPGLPDKNYPVSDVFQKHLGEGFSLRSPEYVPFKDAYFILLDYYQASRPPGSPLGWWLHPDGRVEEVTFSNPANQTWGNLVFTRAGNLLIRMSLTKSSFHEAGIYLDDVKGPLKLVSGRVRDKAFVSPDGCKVAFGNDTRPDIVPGTERHKLQVIDVCQSSE